MEKVVIKGYVVYNKPLCKFIMAGRIKGIICISTNDSRISEKRSAGPL